jgi:Asp-tRNA(Asn)/Glu-tRNA(Gln) amidotransferase A subunit family amidase
MPLVPQRRLTIVEAAAALARGELTSEALVETCLGRIDAWEDQIHAWVSVEREGARRAARECDARFARHRSEGSSEPLPPLLGIPIGIKDIIDVAGQVTGAGSSARMEGPPAEHDASVVRRLRKAGAIILGKTVTTQFACFDPPPTRNPWNLARTPGGSSSGSAAAVAAGMCLGAIGSQTGGSIIRPASFCGVAGCKPTFGRVSIDGIVPVALSLDTLGPIAGCVADLAIMLNAIAGGDRVIRGGDDASLKFAIDLASLAPQNIKPPRLALLASHREFPTPGPDGHHAFGPDGRVILDPYEYFEWCSDQSMWSALMRAVAAFRSEGASVTERDPGLFLSTWQSAIVAFDLANAHRDRFHKLRFDYRKSVAGLIEIGILMTANEYEEARRAQEERIVASDALMLDVDALVCPAALGPAPGPSTTGDPEFNTRWTYTGQPAITIPMELSPDGLPLGIQLIGRRFDEVGLFRTAAWCEAVLPRLMPPESPKEPAG